MSIAISRQLNLVIPITRDDGTTIYVHSSPVSAAVFEVYYLVLAKTFSELAKNGLDPRSGPSVAGLVLKQVAQETMRGAGVSWWDGADGVGGSAGLIAEMVRLSNVITPDPQTGGWATLPLQVALDRGLIGDDERAEVISLLTFFTVSWRVAPRVDRERLVLGMVVIYELQSSHLSVTDFANSLKIANQDAPIGENKAAE